MLCQTYGGPVQDAQVPTGSPERFGSIEDARAFFQGVLRLVHTEHRHSGIALLTPLAGLSRSVDQVEVATADWVHFWVIRRLHSACGDVPPAEFEAAYHQRLEATSEAA